MAEESELKQRLAFLGLTPEDQARLRRLRPALEQNADRFVGAFYRHLLSFEPMRQLLSDPDVKQRLMQKQHDYLLSLARGDLDEDYVEERVRIGDTHVEVGLEPRWYLGAYATYFTLLASLVFESKGGDSVEVERTLGALVKVLMLDAQIAMEAYISKREEQLEYLNRELSEATTKLANALQEQVGELRATTHRAETAEQLASIATLVAGLAHEIGTPMGVIRGHAELLESAAGDEKSRWRAGAIREQVDRISNIIQTLLNIARPREPVRAEVELEPLVEGTLQFLVEKFRRRGIEVKRELGSVPTLSGDSDRLQQLCLNLFLNAADAMPDGGTLTVGLERKGDEVELRVRDTGCGIPLDKVEAIFDPFFTTKPAGQGNGRFG